MVGAHVPDVPAERPDVLATGDLGVRRGSSATASTNCRRRRSSTVIAEPWAPVWQRRPAGSVVVARQRARVVPRRSASAEAKPSAVQLRELGRGDAAWLRVECRSRRSWTKARRRFGAAPLVSDSTRGLADRPCPAAGRRCLTCPSAGPRLGTAAQHSRRRMDSVERVVCVPAEDSSRLGASFDGTARCSRTRARRGSGTCAAGRRRSSSPLKPVAGVRRLGTCERVVPGTASSGGSVSRLSISSR